MPSPNTIEALQAAAAEIGQSVRTERAQLGQIEADLRDFEHAEALGVDGAVVRAGELRASKAEVEQRLSDLQIAQNSTDKRLRDLLEVHAANEKVRRNQTIARLAPKYLKLSEKSQKLAELLGETLNEMQSTGDDLSDSIGSNEASRLLGLSAFRDRVQHAFYMPLTYKITGSASHGTGSSDPRASWFGYSVANRSACRESLVERTEIVLDHIETVFSSETAARHRAARLDATGQTTHVLPLVGTGLFQLVRATLRGAAARLKKGAST